MNPSRRSNTALESFVLKMVPSGAQSRSSRQVCEAIWGPKRDTDCRMREWGRMDWTSAPGRDGGPTCECTNLWQRTEGVFGDLAERDWPARMSRNRLELLNKPATLPSRHGRIWAESLASNDQARRHVRG